MCVLSGQVEDMLLQAEWGRMAAPCLGFVNTDAWAEGVSFLDTVNEVSNLLDCNAISQVANWSTALSRNGTQGSSSSLTLPHITSTLPQVVSLGFFWRLAPFTPFPRRLKYHQGLESRVFLT